MAGIAKDIKPTEVHQSPADLWVIGTPPADGTPRLTLAADGTPDSVTNGACVHLGALAQAVTRVKPKIAPIALDQFDAPIDGYATELEAALEAEFYQTEMQKLQRALGVATYSAEAGYKQIVFGGTLTVPTMCIAAISAKRENPLRHLVSVLFKAAATGGFQLSLGRSKANSFKCAFQGLADVARGAGKQVGTIYETLADAAAGTPSAKAFSVTEIQQGPAELWLIDPAPTDAAVRVTLDALTLTPDAAAHANAKHLGGTEGPVTLTVSPKVSFIRMDQFDAPVDATVESIEAKLEATMSQASVEKLALALAVGNYTLTAGAHAQATFGGTSQPPALCIAAIAPKRNDPTKAFGACLFRVHSMDGIEIATSRSKAATYKVTFTGMTDVTRTAGKQIGAVWETV